jgi:hypothetical protein
MLRISLFIAALALPNAATAQHFLQAGPIWNDNHARQVCTDLAATWNGTWTGHWVTTVPSEMSVCEIRLDQQPTTRAVNAGPIWSENHAENVCPAIAASHGAEWTGQWWTTIAGEMSVCQIR